MTSADRLCFSTALQIQRFFTLAFWVVFPRGLLCDYLYIALFSAFNFYYTFSPSIAAPQCDEHG